MTPSWRRRSGGSSPHTRGAQLIRGMVREHERIIPAYAGSTSSAFSRMGERQDHPRIRGEHGPGNRSREDAVGIIPAYAGSTPTRASGTNRRWDHPRIRGEHGGALSSPSGVSGSSPHTRGALTQYTPTHYITGIIPAYAGSTSTIISKYPNKRDHPRIRGEHISCSRFVPAIMGSSPHTRGAPTIGWCASDAHRIIPAYAGSTQFRVCGLSK